MRHGVAAVLVTVLVAAPALAAAPPTYKIAIRDHAFAPPALTVPAGVRVKLRVTNTRHLPSEFESFDLNREKVVPPGSTVTVWVGPLNAGKYKIFDDFNPGTTGWIVAAKSAGGARP